VAVEGFVVKEASRIASNWRSKQSLQDYLKENNFKHIVIDAKIEDELKDLIGDEKEMFRKELGGLGSGMRESAESDDGIDRLIKSGYELLNLITYFTTGEDESRAWTIVRGSTAPVASMAADTCAKAASTLWTTVWVSP